MMAVSLEEDTAGRALLTGSSHALHLRTAEEKHPRRGESRHSSTHAD